MAKQFTLGRSERLKSRKAMETLFASGIGFNQSPLRVIYLLKETGQIQFGVGVSAKNFKKAVDRNLIKRRIREAYRLQRQPLSELLQSQNKGMDLFFTYTAKEILAYADICNSVQRSINKLLSKFHENNP